MEIWLHDEMILDRMIHSKIISFFKFWNYISFCHDFEAAISHKDRELSGRENHFKMDVVIIIFIDSPVRNCWNQLRSRVVSQMIIEDTQELTLNNDIKRFVIHMNVSFERHEIVFIQIDVQDKRSKTLLLYE